MRRLDSPRRCLRWEERTVKLEANMEAVILRQSVQLQMNVVTKPGPWRGCGVLEMVIDGFEKVKEEGFWK